MFMIIQISLGVMHENPSSTQGVIRILEGLQKYVPQIDSNNTYPMVVWGDGLSCERTNDAQFARVNGATPTSRLESFQPAAQEFHKRMINLQV